MRYRVAVQGFSAFERSTFASFFRLAARRTPAYDPVPGLAECDFAIVDADLPSAVEAVRAAGKWGVALVIGGTPGGPGLARLPRPINLMNLLRVLDELALAEAAPAARAATLGPPSAPAAGRVPSAPPATAKAAGASGAREAGDTVPAHSGLPGSDSPAAPWARAAGRTRWGGPPPGLTTRRLQPDPHSDFGADRGFFSSAVLVEGDARFDHILVVDDSEIALRFIQSRLRRFGFQVHLARSGEEALQMLDEREFRFVFLDVMMRGMDGYQTCKLIKRRVQGPGRQPPVVVMLTSRAGTIDKIRGTLAGCDAYLTKPLVEDELVRVIGEHDEVFQRSFDTTVGGIAAARPPQG